MLTFIVDPTSDPFMVDPTSDPIYVGFHFDTISCFVP